MVQRLQTKAESIGRILNNLEKKYNSTHNEKDGFDMKKSPSGNSIGSRRPQRIQAIPPFNASKIRKSPSTAEAAGLATVDASPLTETNEAIAETSETNEAQKTILEVSEPTADASEPAAVTAEASDKTPTTETAEAVADAQDEPKEVDSSTVETLAEAIAE